MIRFTRILMTAAILALPVLSHAQNETSGLALQSMIIGHSPVAQGMGGAGLLSTSSLAWGAYGNIAALPFSNLKGDAQVSYNNWNPTSTNYINGAVGFNLKNKVGISGGFSSGSGKEFELFDDNGNATGQFTPKNIRAGFGISWRFIEWMSIGANLAVSKETLLEGYSCQAAAADVFLMGEFNGIKATAGISKIGGKVKDSAGNDYPLATSVAAAIGYAKDFDKNRIEVEADLDYFLSASSPVSVSMGAAYTFNDMVSVRAGYHTGGVISNFASVGLGLKFFGVRLDAAYTLAGSGSPVGNAVTAGLGYCF